MEDIRISLAPPVKKSRRKVSPPIDPITQARNQAHEVESEDASLRQIARHLKAFRNELLTGNDAFDKDSAEFFCGKYLDVIFGTDDVVD